MTHCRHFGTCGGCSLQDMPPDDYRAAKRQGVAQALARAGLDSVRIEEVVSVAQGTRRRAVFKLAKKSGALEIGFHAARSHAIIDMRECLVLTPGLVRLAQQLRAALAPVFHDGEAAELHATETGSGFDLGLRWSRKLTPALTAEIAAATHGFGIARIIFNSDVLLENAPPHIALGGVDVALPPHAFLQASGEGEAALQDRVLALTAGAKNIVDLFAGLGTFTLPLARKAKVHAVEQDGAALAALAAAKGAGLKPVTTEKRDLFKLPLTPLDLKAYDAAVLDPPRAGALAQVTALAASRVPRIVYVSCDAASFARDAAVLVKAGFTPGPVTPVDQFLFSSHIELVGGFVRPK